MTIKKDATDKYAESFCRFDFVKNRNVPESFLKKVRGARGERKKQFYKNVFSAPLVIHYRFLRSQQRALFLLSR